jgi:hypothetical protein
MASIETATKIAIISKALILCGEKPLSSLSDERYGATVGSNLFEVIYENELQTGTRWRFACKKRALSRLVGEPLNEWQYAFQMPTDMLLPIGIFPRKTLYEIYGDHLYTNVSSVDLDYMFKPDVSKVPAYFSMLMIYALAKDMIKPVTESETAVDKMTAKYNIQKSKSEYADAQGRPNVPIADSPFTDVRA